MLVVEKSEISHISAENDCEDSPLTAIDELLATESLIQLVIATGAAQSSDASST
jgi:hypothetical protein